jgi:hypothetical protein
MEQLKMIYVRLKGFVRRTRIKHRIFFAGVEIQMIVRSWTPSPSFISALFGTSGDYFFFFDRVNSAREIRPNCSYLSLLGRV